MATDVDVQYFSHLNGLTLGNNWGDLIRLLDKALVTGIDFTQITSASIDAQGDVHITLYAAHNAMLFQVVELSGFSPASLNQKYRIKGVPSATELILKPHTAIVETNITTVGTGKLASLGYEIIFRDTNDVKRVYRAKNPTAQHPFIRVDESISSDTGSYTSTYAKYAMVGLLEHMDHIDDYQNPSVLQLPFDPADPTKNWKISGTGSSVVRGWSRWYFARNVPPITSSADTVSPSSANRTFTFCGDKNAFYLLNSIVGEDTVKALHGIGLYDDAIDTSLNPWFLMGPLVSRTASELNGYTSQNKGTYPLTQNINIGTCFFINRNNELSPLQSHIDAYAITPDYETGSHASKIKKEGLSALQIPFMDADGVLRGNLQHICYAGRMTTIPLASRSAISGNSMYVTDSLYAVGANNEARGAVHFYLGELE